MNGLTIGKKKLETLKQMPIIETRVKKSKDGSYIINRTTITTIKPVEYFQAVLDSDPQQEEEPEVTVEEEKVEL
ncbi:MAG: hypothetical protein ACOC32_02660 [Nanoarchaeota archaeon]